MPNPRRGLANPTSGHQRPNFSARIAQPRYPNRVETVTEAVSLLSQWKNAHRVTHHWSPIDVTLTDGALFETEKLTRSAQVTAAFLLGIARWKALWTAHFPQP